MHRDSFADDRVADLRTRWTPEATAAAVAFLESRPVAYDLPTIKRWLRVFVERFFEQSQYKRSAMPNGPKVGTGGSLSPRGDWRAPSDASATAWVEELERNVPGKVGAPGTAPAGASGADPAGAAAPPAPGSKKIRRAARRGGSSSRRRRAGQPSR